MVLGSVVPDWPDRSPASRGVITGSCDGHVSGERGAERAFPLARPSQAWRNDLRPASCPPLVDTAGVDQNRPAGLNTVAVVH
jgi:hypothetical protein